VSLYATEQPEQRDKGTHRDAQDKQRCHGKQADEERGVTEAVPQSATPQTIGRGERLPARGRRLCVRESIAAHESQRTVAASPERDARNE
jgi:hypothetical protein